MSTNSLSNAALQATGIVTTIVTGLIFGGRLAMGVFEKRAFSWEDGWLAAAWVVFMVISSLYMAAGPVIFRLEDLAAGRIDLYPEVMDDSLTIQKTFFVTTSGLWISLWLVKVSLLTVYKRLMTNVRLFTILWWATLVICILTLAGAITSSMLSCSSMSAWFTAGACGTPRDVKAAYISLWYSYSVDVFTDLLVMLLPLGLIRNLQMNRARKMSIAGLFCLGWVCIAVSTIRVAYLGHNGGAGGHTQPSTSWLALWGIVESGIAVIIGCGPGFYRRAKAASKAQTGSGYYNMKYGNGHSARSKTDERAGDISLHTYPRSTIQINKNSSSSQEELVDMDDDKIRVTQSVMIRSEAMMGEAR
ncbi:hypothetical protein F5X68DRAFT_253476 [Plectosphaerella plurivora]|uniref:Rhodopsin domain-containing protein n=1 Tax=Plectosphaerella plurivora TaxID=936078 RepID=A0A9P8VGY7_9PEZI|nr:hypothetical protein F5X68DRAFT_253476 [Plectosphaerella plurivora]